MTRYAFYDMKLVVVVLWLVLLGYFGPNGFTTTDAWMQSHSFRSWIDRQALYYRHTNRKQTPKPMIYMVDHYHLQTDSDMHHERDVIIAVDDSISSRANNRRNFIRSTTSTAVMTVFGSAMMIQSPLVANAVGPVKIALTPLQYSAVICPPDRPIPGEKAMIGMRGLCVTVRAKLDGASPKELEKVGVYGFVNDGESGDSVLANNPDGGTDAGQFAMIESVTPQDSTVTFEFIAAVPRDKDLSIYENGIGPLNFSSLRLISYPGGQQFGAISPCEMNEFSDECEEWERANGPYKKADYMVKSNPRTKGS